MNQKTILKIYLCGAWVFALMAATGACAQDHATSISLESMYAKCLQGQMNDVLEWWDQQDHDDLTDDQIALRKRYESRFVNGKDLPSDHISHPEIAQLQRSFERYWLSALIHPDEVDQAERTLAKELETLSGIEHGAQMSPDTFKVHLEAWALDRGYHALLVGKTAHLRDCFIWKVDSVARYTIPLVQDTVMVEVHLMSDFLSFGWMGFTTFDRTHAGGWATREALFAVKESYDLESESYQVSYLCHEGQHFLDYQHFPRLTGTDLEYRAKLVELIMAQERHHILLQHFQTHAADLPGQHHPRANFLLTTHLQQWMREQVADFDGDWNSVSKADIRKGSLALLKAHTKLLNALGADRVESAWDIPEKVEDKSAAQHE
ncbi:hypothetical protein [Pontibacter sp. G13]|uniref:hypothetical protein n=1 Tax=Pontibacter sp. G13 TaxID=3074898 RepID=UPI00288B0865|nr:hypothetical protein [Pontibacter sp. G13]WNJ18467.1 hypothetical protein RJD25_26730 [Pontibacter sp. G13]